MPRYPRWGPYKTSVVSSGSEKTFKKMTTVPKPTLSSPWNDWRVAFVEEKNKLVWEPTGYDVIVDYLNNQLAKLLSEVKTMDGIKLGDDCLLIQIRVKKEANIHSPISWYIFPRFENKTSMENKIKKHARGAKGVEDKKMDIEGLGKFNLNDLAVQFSLLDDFQAEYSNNVELYKGHIRGVVKYNVLEPCFLEWKIFTVIIIYLFKAIYVFIGDNNLPYVEHDCHQYGKDLYSIGDINNTVRVMRTITRNKELEKHGSSNNQQENNHNKFSKKI